MSSEDLKDCALSVFPEELWGIILHSVGDSADIHNVLAAFPILDTLFEEKKVIWYFNEVFPHLYKYGQDLPYGKNLISSCLEVCKTWRNITEDFVKNHPSRHSYNAHGLTRRSVPYNDFSYQALTEEAVGCLSLINAEKIISFTETMHLWTLRLFQAKTVHLINQGKNIESVERFLDACLIFLDTFGSHILRIGFTIPNMALINFKTDKHILAKTFQCLAKLTNCSYLYLDLDFYTVRYGPEDYGESHDLMHFECVEFSLRMPLGIQGIFLQYMKPIKKLITDQHTVNLDSIALHSITDLQIGVAVCAQNLEGIARLAKTLKRLTGETVFTACKRSLFELLGRLKLEEVVLDSYRLWGRYDVPKGIEFPTVKYLLLTDYYGQNWDFVIAFTSLEHLELCWSDEWKIMKNDVSAMSAIKPPSTVTEVLRNYMYKSRVPADVKIWSLLPSLQLLTINGNDDPTFQVRYTRSGGNMPFYSFVDWITDEVKTNE